MNTFHLCFGAAESAGLRLLLIGGHAVNARGYERTTVDVDFLIPLRDPAKWKTILAGAGFCLFRETEAFAQFDPASPQEILERYASPTIKERLLGDLSELH